MLLSPVRETCKLDWKEYWHNRSGFLLRSGYRLRPGYDRACSRRPKHGLYSEKRLAEDQLPFHMRSDMIWAERVSDGCEVMLKVTSTTLHPFEVEIGSRLFSSPQHAGNPRNHCVPIFDVLQDPDDLHKQIIVMPRLVPFDFPAFDTVGEVVDCFRQIFEGLQYMHENFVAHRNCGFSSILQDPTELIPDGFRPGGGHNRRTTRTEYWPRYYLADLSLSRQYNPAQGLPFEDVVLPGPGVDKPPPEHDYVACNPFPTDVHLVGDILKRGFLLPQPYSKQNALPSRIHPPLKFLGPLVDDMTLMDPASRPTIGEVLHRFDELMQNLSWWNLRQPGQPQRCWYERIAQRLRQIRRLARGIPALPVRPYNDTMPGSPQGLRRSDAALHAFYTRTDREAVYR